MNTGENEQGLRAITDFLRKGSIILLVMHCYVQCYGAFELWGLTADIVKRILLNFKESPVLANYYYVKLFVIGLLALSLVGSTGKKDEKIQKATIINLVASGLLLYFGSGLLFFVNLQAEQVAILYMLATAAGFVLFLAGGARLSRLIKLNLQKDIFNEENETFPQEERLLSNEYSINLPAQYRLKKKVKKSYINFINMFRALLVCGTPGSR